MGTDRIFLDAERLKDRRGFLRSRTANRENVVCPLALEYRRHAHPARGADRNQAATRAPLGELFRERADDACARRGKGMSQSDAAAFRIELGPIDAAERRRAFQLGS